VGRTKLKKGKTLGRGRGGFGRVEGGREISADKRETASTKERMERDDFQIFSGDEKTTVKSLENQ